MQGGGKFGGAFPHPRFELIVRGTRVADVGSAVELAVRSSTITVAPPALAGGTNVVAGRLREAIYMGSTYQCTVEAGPMRLLATIPLETWSALGGTSAGNAAVCVSIPPADLIILKESQP